MMVFATGAPAVDTRQTKTLSWDTECIRLVSATTAEWHEARHVLAADPSYAPCTSGVRCTAGAPSCRKIATDQLIERSARIACTGVQPHRPVAEVLIASCITRQHIFTA